MTHACIDIQRKWADIDSRRMNEVSQQSAERLKERQKRDKICAFTGFSHLVHAATLLNMLFSELEHCGGVLQASGKQNG